MSLFGRIGGSVPMHFRRRSVEDYHAEDYGDLSPSQEDDEAEEVLASGGRQQGEPEELFVWVSS
jgi:hypothetical protein